MDMLFDLENGIYLRLYSTAGADVGVEIAINVLTPALNARACSHMVCLEEETHCTLSAFPRISEHSRSCARPEGHGGGQI